MRISTPSTVTGAPSGSPALPSPEVLHASADPAGFASLLRQRISAPAPAPQPQPAMQTSAAPPNESPPRVEAAPPRASAAQAERSNGERANAEPSNEASGEAARDDSAARDSTEAAATSEQAVSLERGRAPGKPRSRGAETNVRAAGDASPGAPSATGNATDATAATAPSDTPDSPGAHQAAAGAGADALAPWLAALQRAPIEREAVVAGGGSARDARDARDVALGAGEAAGLAKDAATLTASIMDAARNAFAAAADGGRADARFELNAEPIAAAFATLVADAAASLGSAAPSEDRPAASAATAASGLDGASALLASNGPDAVNPNIVAPEATAVAIATPVDSPDFAQVLGVQLSVLAKDGVQKAELHLNPADMGPVSVQIVMDGTQARIDFGADVAATRHAIESGLPELASALRDAGFTLAGGGVSQQSQPRHQGDDAAGGRGGGRGGMRRISDDGVARVATAASRLVGPNGVDLYA